VLGSCGPAPSDMPDSQALFRQGIAHSAPTIDDEDSVAADPASVTLDTHEHMLAMTATGHGGMIIERRMTLLSEGTTLVGQDRIVSGADNLHHRLAVRFHLGPGVMVRRIGNEGIARLVLPNGMIWSFLWEGADFHDEESVRQSAYLGFHRTRQLVLEADAVPGAEVAWILTLEQ
jgi:uncharacterized heparinase superfamily protein